MTQLFSNNFSTTLLNACASTDLSLVLSSIVGLPVPNIGNSDYCYLTLSTPTTPETAWEVVKMTINPQTGSITVARAQDGTTALAWPIGTRIECRMCNQSVKDIITAVVAAQTTANTATTNAAAAQSTANTGVTNAATAQATANSAITNAATAQAAANAAAAKALISAQSGDGNQTYPSTGKMAGLGTGTYGTAALITPKSTGNFVVVIAVSAMTPSTNGSNLNVQAFVGTGTPPAVGTVNPPGGSAGVGGDIKPLPGPISSFTLLFSFHLSPGSTYWFDLWFSSQNSTMTATNLGSIDFVIFEI